MDCQTAKEYIDLYADGMLDDAAVERLKAHLQSCECCREELEKTTRLKHALAGLDTLQPPQGLAKSAIRKARRTRPIFAYATAAVAAVAALVFVFASGILTNERSLSQKAAENQAAYSMAPEMMAAPDANADDSFTMSAAGTAPEAYPQDEDGRDMLGTGAEPCEVTIPANQSAELKDMIMNFLNDLEIEYSQSDDGRVLSFTLSEGYLPEFEMLLSTSDVVTAEAFRPDCPIVMTFE